MNGKIDKMNFPLDSISRALCYRFIYYFFYHPHGLITTTENAILDVIPSWIMELLPLWIEFEGFLFLYYKLPKKKRPKGYRTKSNQLTNWSNIYY